jgi:hypothetical protein
MFDRFKKGPIPADHGAEVYTSAADHPGDDHDPAEDADQAELISLFPVDPKLVLAHEAEEHVGP